jgi:ribosomal-protein-alanine N-acetyltransferase
MDEINFQLRPLDSYHAEAMSAIHIVTIAEKSWLPQVFQIFFTKEGVTALGAFQGDRLLGFILARTVLGETEILTFAVSPLAQKQGIGSKLLEQLCSKVPHPLILEVAKTNTPAIGLYKKFGFQQIGERKDYYKINETRIDALVMKR